MSRAWRNRHEIYGKGYTYVVTRRIIQRKNGTVLRVRFQAFAGVLASGQPVVNDFRDYGHLAAGDAAFEKLVKQTKEHTRSGDAARM